MKRIFLPLLLPLLLLSCAGGGERTGRVASVKTIEVGTATGTTTSSFPGKVKASGEAALSFRIAGPISRIYARPGKLVRRGEVLATLDSRDYSTQLAATEAEYASVRAQAERIIKLHEAQSVSDNDYDKAVGGLRQITEKLRAHRAAVADTRLVAPYDGYIREPLRREGETVGAGMPVLMIYSDATPEVEISISAQDYMRRDQFESFVCTTDVAGSEEIPLRLVSIDPIASSSQLYTVRLAFVPKADQTLPTVGMNANVRIRYTTDTTQVATIPMTAIWERDKRSHVWLITAGTPATITAREIELSEIKRDGTAVCTGLEPGMIIVSAGASTFTEGQAVRAISAPSPTNVGGLL